MQIIYQFLKKGKLRKKEYKLQKSWNWKMTRKAKSRSGEFALTVKAKENETGNLKLESPHSELHSKL